MPRVCSSLRRITPAVAALSRWVFCGTLAASVLLAAPSRAQNAGDTEGKHAATDTDRAMAAHALNRLAFGPTPGQVDRVAAQGWESWARAQLHPGDIDDGDSERRIVRDFPAEAFTLEYIYDQRRNGSDEDFQRLRDRVREHVRGAILVRAVTSKRQFAEVICEFWRNHFSVDMGEDDVGYLVGDYERSVIRRHAFGKFEDLLMASAKHPAMLKYLDNDVSQKPLTPREVALIERNQARRYVPRSVAALSRQRGLNENYARELLELHTLGVDRDYTQRDVTELARVLTGWTVGQNDDGQYGFVFRKNVHDNNTKHVLGATLRDGGISEGERVIHGLAHHRFTADFIATKLCRYLVDDDPPAELIDHAARVFRETDGDLTAVYEAIIFSPAFADPQYRGTKFKTPFEFVASALRATDATIENPEPVLYAMNTMGMPVYECPDPTGWYDQAEAWLDPGVLVYRWQFAVALGHNQFEGVRLPEALLASSRASRIKRKLVPRFAPTGLSETTAGVLREKLADNPSSEIALTLLLGSPEFQAQ